MVLFPVISAYQNPHKQVNKEEIPHHYECDKVQSNVNIISMYSVLIYFSWGNCSVHQVSPITCSCSHK